MDRETLPTDTIVLSWAPEQQAVTFRRFRGDEDYANILAAINGSKAADGTERADTLEEVAHNYSHLVNCDPYRDMLFAEVGGKAVGYTRLWWTRNSNGDWIGSHLAFLLPEWRAKGIGSTFIQHNETRLEEIATGLIRTGVLKPDVSRYYDVFTEQTEESKEALLRRYGYKPARYFFRMVRPDLENIPEAPLPDGLEVRTVEPEHLTQIWAAAQEAFRDHWNYVPPAEEDYHNWATNPINNTSLWKVAWAGDQVAGMVLSFINQTENQEYNRKRGYTEDISVRRPWRKRGLARSLIVQSFYALKERGMLEAALGVDAENLTGALRLYESVGFRATQRSAIFRKPF